MPQTMYTEKDSWKILSKINDVKILIDIDLNNGENVKNYSLITIQSLVHIPVWWIDKIY